MYIQLKIKSLDKLSLKLYLNYLKNIFFKLKLKNFTIQNLPLEKKKLTLLKSPHVNKKALEQFEFVIYKSLVTLKDFKKLILLKYIIINKPKNLKLSLKKRG